MYIVTSKPAKEVNTQKYIGHTIGIFDDMQAAERAILRYLQFKPDAGVMIAKYSDTVYATTITLKKTKRSNKSEPLKPVAA